METQTKAISTQVPTYPRVLAHGVGSCVTESGVHQVREAPRCGELNRVVLPHSAEHTERKVARQIDTAQETQEEDTRHTDTQTHGHTDNGI